MEEEEEEVIIIRWKKGVHLLRVLTYTRQAFTAAIPLFHLFHPLIAESFWKLTKLRIIF